MRKGGARAKAGSAKDGSVSGNNMDTKNKASINEYLQGGEKKYKDGYGIQYSTILGTFKGA